MRIEELDDMLLRTGTDDELIEWVVNTITEEDSFGKIAMDMIQNLENLKEAIYLRIGDSNTKTHVLLALAKVNLGVRIMAEELGYRYENVHQMETIVAEKLYEIENHVIEN